MKIINSFIVVLISVLFFGCEAEDVELNQILGDWQLQSTSVDINIVDEKPVKFDLDLSEYQSTISFKEDGTFTTKSNEAVLLKLKQQNVEIADYSLTFGGTYTIENGVFTINSKDQNNKSQKSKFKITFQADDTFWIEMNKAIYLDMIKVELETQKTLLAAYGLTVDMVIEELSADVLKFDYKTIYKKVK